MIGRSGERGSGISVLVAQHDDDIYKLSFSYSFVIILLVKDKKNPTIGGVGENC